MDTYPVGLFEIETHEDQRNGLMVSCNNLATQYLCEPSDTDWSMAFDASSKQAIFQRLWNTHIAMTVSIKGSSYVLATNKLSNRVYCVLIKVSSRRLLTTASSSNVSTHMLSASLSLHVLQQTQRAIQRKIDLALSELSSALSVNDIDSISKLQLSDLGRGTTESRITHLLEHIENIQFVVEPSAQGAMNLDPFLFLQSVRWALEYFDYNGQGSVSYVTEDDQGEIQVRIESPRQPSTLPVDVAFVNDQQLALESCIGTNKSLVLCRTFAEAMSGRIFLDSFEDGATITIAIPHLDSAPQQHPVIFKPTVPIAETRSSFNTPVEQRQPAVSVAETRSSFDKPRPPIFPVEKFKQPAVPNVETRSSIDKPVEPEKPVVQVSRPLRVLIVEDNSINAQVLGRTIKSIIPSVILETAKDGRLAVEMSRSSRFDCIFMDIDIPILNGFEVAQAVRRYEREQKIDATYIVGVSGSDNTDQERRLQISGIDTFIKKPCKTPRVAEALGLVPIKH